MAENAVFWKQGLFLHPQHFQLMSRQIRGAIEPFCGLQSQCLGRGHLRIRESALENGILDIVSGDFLFPTGPTFACHQRRVAVAQDARFRLEDDDANGGGLLTAHVACAGGTTGAATFRYAKRPSRRGPG